MTPTEQQIHALLERKQELTQFTPTYRWLVEAVELMLRAQLELREDMRIRLGSVSPPDEPWWDSTRPADKP
jgi:hypothetical protein